MISRRRLLAGTAALAAAPAVGWAEQIDPTAIRSQEKVRRNASSFQAQNWRDHFSDLGKATIVCDTISRALHFWSGDGSIYKVYPTSVPLTDDLKRTGYTEIVRKKVGPDWTPTPSMMKRDPSLHYMPPGPDNPLGTHAMYLSWPAYLIHGTHDTRKIGRRSSSGCIGTYNELIAELFELTPVGTQVRVI
ncbi:L,D-transpeptidase [Vannielia litorea]|uniref:L,D-transpeptidase n=1 Tax=Vannielia TaxID=2813041 RepID=UPI001C943B9B|nr:L,D-transpeptidase [Vannielia litorea]MBY6046658.1 L,D-transpeptidase [Vannielia litorea]MBY6074072.1 L,D-transpeptidase [Vannielia litorea]MBY6153434.1 L,D-transpeptidase [Vannielia litorea]